MKESERQDGHFNETENGLEKKTLVKKVKGIIKRDKPKFEEVEKTEQEIKEMVSFGKFLLRDIPLFKYEMLIYLGIIGVAAMSWLLERTELVPGAMGKAFLPLAIIPFAIWLIKKQFYMPGKTRLPRMHAHGSKVITLSTVDPRKGFIEIGPKENRKKIWLAKINKHTEESTGLPFIITTEFDGENISLLKDSTPDMKSQEFNAILEMLKATTTKSVMKRMLGFQQTTAKNPMLIIAMIQLALLVFILVKTLNLF
ncbi:hypothetical protein LCGC14_0968430 [marine sediment metagenome]|uniref:YcxB-like protein domain-containing protein n=1 Tax=marine sediment metagenome TaxID=412755 RepID=A0A0F9RIV3_9ZZZZ